MLDESISFNDNEEWLRGQLVYTSHRGVRRNFLRNRIIVSDMDEQWQADLVDLQEFKNKNNGNAYILTIVDLFSKYAWAIPIKNKGSKAVTSAFSDLFENVKGCQLSFKLMKELKSLITMFKMCSKKTECNISQQLIQKPNAVLRNASIAP